MIESKKYPWLDGVSEKGEAIYRKIKDRYEEAYRGKILAIAVHSGDVYMADSVVEALELAKSTPDSPSYVLRIGFDSVYQI